MQTDILGYLIRVNLEFIGYTLINSEVYLNLDMDNPEWQHDIDLVRWYYKTSRK